MREVNLTLGRMLRIWWLYHWRIAAGGAVLAVLVLGAVGPGAPPPPALAAAALAALLLWTYFAMRMALGKCYRGFRIALLRGPSEVPAGARQAGRIWWFYTWRNAIALLLLSLPQLAAILAAGKYTGEYSAWRALDIFWTFALMYMVLRRKYGDLRIAMVAAD